MLNLARIIESQDTENISRLERSSSLLDELRNTVLRSDQAHDHLHDFNLGIRFASLDVLSTLDEEAD